jgi:hypothetical protein
MGAAGTSFEDALHDEFHINDSSDDPHPALTHEMAHIFAAHIDRWVPICWKIGIHEGIAVAAEWTEESARLELTPHEASAAMDSLGILPDLSRSLSAFGFWTQPGARAYTACGSFVRFLVDTYGMERFRRLWRRGDFAAAYDKPLATLLSEWRQSLAAIPLGGREMRRAERLFRPASVFAQPCAHELAQLEERAALALAGGDAASAESLSARLVAIDPNPEHEFDLARARLRRGTYESVLTSLTAQAATASTTPTPAAARLARLGADAAWLAGRPAAETRAAYERAAALATSDTDARAAEVTLATLDDPRLRERLRNYLTDLGLPEAAGLALLAETRLAAPDAALPRYLLGRRLFFANQWEAAATELRAAVAAGSLGSLTQHAALELVGRSELAAGRAEAARATFERLLAEPLPASVRLGIEDWKWRSDQALATPTPPAASR